MAKRAGGKRASTAKQAGKYGAMRRKGLPKSAAARIANAKPKK